MDWGVFVDPSITQSRKTTHKSATLGHGASRGVWCHGNPFTLPATCLCIGVKLQGVCLRKAPKFPTKPRSSLQCIWEKMRVRSFPEVTTPPPPTPSPHHHPPPPLPPTPSSLFHYISRSLPFQLLLCLFCSFLKLPSLLLSFFHYFLIICMSPISPPFHLPAALYTRAFFF